MYFKAIVTDEEVKIRATRDIKDVMMAVTMICNRINRIEEYSESDRATFREFVKEELAKLAFADDVDELRKEQERLAKKKMVAEKNRRRILDELSELLDFDEDENE